ncbi:MAG: hypothetical protein WAO58_06325 [Fimbriimonadaceae bacterium]
MNLRIFFLVLALLFLAYGCGPQKELSADKTGAEPAAATENAPTEESDTAALAKLATLEKAQSAARVTYLKTPSDKAAKAGFVRATNEMALHLMYVESIPPGVRYPRALKLFREVTEVDPKNEEALKWIGTIEDIYKSMGRPVPKA